MESFETLPQWLEFIKTNTYNRQIPIILLVNKANLSKDKKVLNVIDIMKFAEHYKIPTIEVTSSYNSIEQGMNLCISSLCGNILSDGITNFYKLARKGFMRVGLTISAENRRSSSQEIKKKKKCC